MKPSDVVYLGQFARATNAQLDAIPLRVASIDDLITNKRAVGRPQDLIDVAFLERVRDGRK